MIKFIKKIVGAVTPTKRKFTEPTNVYVQSKGIIG